MPTEMGKLFGLDAFNTVDDWKRQAEHVGKLVAAMKRLSPERRVPLIKGCRAYMQRVKDLLDAEIAKCDDDRTIDNIELAKNVIDRELELIERTHAALDGEENP